MKTIVQDIFRSGRHDDDGKTHQNSPAQLSTPSHRTIFRRPKGSNSPSTNSASSEESIMVSLHRGPSWPPLTIPESESADTKSKLLGLSRPIQSGGSMSRHMELSASASSEREYRQKPLYYKIQMRNGMAKLASGDDSSVMIADDHNDRIQLTPTQARKHRLFRASNITEASSSSSRSPARKGPEHQQTWQVETWEVIGNGQIVAAQPATPSSLGDSRQTRIATSTPTAPKKSFLQSMRTSATPPRSAQKNTPESPPKLQKSSFDTLSTDASSSDNSFCNEILDMTEPSSPPRMDRMSCPDQVLFDDGSKESKSSKRWSSRSQTSSGSGRKKDSECCQQKKDDSCNAGFISQLFDLISFGPCCHMDSMCRGRDQTVS